MIDIAKYSEWIMSDLIVYFVKLLETSLLLVKTQTFGKPKNFG